jgi:transposase
LLDHDLSVVFYDLTTIRAEGESELADDVRTIGHSKDRDLPARQVVVGVVQSACGLPLLHTVHKGNIAETATLLTMVRTLKSKLPIKRLVLVADRGLMSADNLTALKASDCAVEFIMAVPAKRYRVLAPAIRELAFKADETAVKNLPSVEAEEDVGPGLRQHRLVVSRNAERATYERCARDAVIAEICQLSDAKAEKLEAQDAGTPAKGTRLTDAKVYHQIRSLIENKGLSRIIRVELNEGLFSYHIDQQALERAQTLDGVLVITTSLSESDMSAERVAERYRALADIETGFKVLKNEIEMAPMFHRLPTRIIAHGAICFLALVLNRYLRQQLKRHGREESPRRLLEQLRQIRLCAVRQGTERSQSITEIPSEQKQLLTQLNLPLPNPPDLAQ